MPWTPSSVISFRVTKLRPGEQTMTFASMILIPGAPCGPFFGGGPRAVKSCLRCMIAFDTVNTASMPRSMSRRDLLAARTRPAAETPGHWIRVHREAMACRFEVTLSGEDARHVGAAREAL